MMPIVYREVAKAKCPACLREKAVVRDSHENLARISRHLYQEQVLLNEIDAPTEYTDGFCPGSFEGVTIK